MRGTRIVVSPVKGITWRQYKTARKYLKRHKVDFGQRSVMTLLSMERLVVAVANTLSPRKHRWDHA